MLRWIKSPKPRAITWTACVLAVAGLFGFQAVRGLHLETNILKLLPHSEQDPIVTAALDHFADLASRRTVLLVGSDDQETAQQAALEAGHLLENSKVFDRVIVQQDNDPQRAYFDVFFPARAGLVPLPLVHEVKRAGDLSPLLDRLAETLYTPALPGLNHLLREDPLLLFPQAMQRLPEPPGQTTMNDGFIEIDDGETLWVLVQLATKGSPFSKTWQEPVIKAIEESIQAVREAHPGIQTRYSGVVKFAHNSTQRAENEAGAISTVSMAAVLLLLVITFRSPVQMLLGIVPIAIGLLFAFTGSFLVFGELHLLTLGFGASLIGVCIDYTFHYFAEGLTGDGSAGAQARLRRIFPGITLGMLTSIMGYLGLCAAPFPGLRQMAVFSCIGLLGAFGTVVCWLPVLPQGKPRTSPPILLRWGNGILHLWETRLKGAARVVLFLLLLGAGLIGTAQLKPDDDIRNLQPQDQDLVENERIMQTMTGPLDISRFFVTQAGSQEELLDREAELAAVLSSAVQTNGLLQWAQSAAHFVPPRRQQLETVTALYQADQANPELLETTLTSFGMKPEAVVTARKSIDPAFFQPLELSDFLALESSELLRSLCLEDKDGRFASITLLGGIEDPAFMAFIDEELDGVTYVDKVGEYSDLFTRYRELGSKLVLASYGVIALVLLFRYGRRRFIMVFAPPCIAALATLALVGFAGIPLSLFHVLGLLLVLGIGIDYTIFFAECRSQPSSIMLAVMLSAATTLLSFGMLAMSSTRALSDFGFTVLIGITIALLLSPSASNASNLEPRMDTNGRQ